MSLENEIKKLTAAVEQLTAKMQHIDAAVNQEVTNAVPQQTPAAPAPAAPAVETPAAPAAPAAPTQAAPAPAAPTAPQAPAQPQQSAPEAPAAQVMDAASVNQILQEKAKAMGDGGAAIFKVLQEQFQVQNLSSLDPSRYPELVNAIKEL